MYSRSRPAVSISGTSGTAWNAMCHTHPAGEGRRRSSHPNPGTSISITTSRRTTSRNCAAYAVRDGTAPVVADQVDLFVTEAGDQRVDAARHGVGVVPGLRAARVAESGQVDGDHGEVLGQRREDRVPGPPGLRPPVQQDERRPLPADHRVQRHAVGRQRLGTGTLAGDDAAVVDVSVSASRSTPRPPPSSRLTEPRPGPLCQVLDQLPMIVRGSPGTRGELMQATAMEADGSRDRALGGRVPLRARRSVLRRRPVVRRVVSAEEHVDGRGRIRRRDRGHGQR